MLRKLVSHRCYSVSSKADVFKVLDINLKQVIPGVYTGSKWCGSGKVIDCLDPSTNEIIGQVATGTPAEYNEAVSNMQKSMKMWRETPAPRRGEIVRQMRVRLDEKKQELGYLVSLEMGKILPEGLGEVQE